MTTQFSNTYTKGGDANELRPGSNRSLFGRQKQNLCRRIRFLTEDVAAARALRGDIKVIITVFVFTIFFVGKPDPCTPPLPFEFVPNKYYTYQSYVWWQKHWRYLYEPRIVQTADLWPVGKPDGRINLFDYAVFASRWLKGEKQ